MKKYTTMRINYADEITVDVHSDVAGWEPLVQTFVAVFASLPPAVKVGLRNYWLHGPKVHVTDSAYVGFLPRQMPGPFIHLADTHPTELNNIVICPLGQI